MKKSKGQKIIIIFIVILLISALAVIIWANNVISKLTENDMEGEQDYGYHFAMVVENYDNPYWELVYKGALERAQEENVVVEMTGTNLAEEYGLSDRMRMAVSSRVDGIFAVPDGSDNMRTLIKESTENRIPVLSMMENDSKSGRSGYVGINSYEQGQAYGKLIQDIASKQEVDNVVILCYSAKTDEESGDYSADLIYSSIIEYLNNNELSDQIAVSMQNINRASVFNSKRDIKAILEGENPPEIIVCTDYMFTLSTCQVAVDLNQVGKVKILGSYLSNDILYYIQKGTLYGTVAVDPNELGRVCVSEMIELKEIGRTNDYMTLDMMAIDKDNVEEYIARFLGEAE